MTRSNRRGRVKDPRLLLFFLCCEKKLKSNLNIPLQEYSHRGILLSGNTAHH